jgi:predicted acetyltransferase
MSDSVHVRPLQGDAEVDDYAEILSTCFASPVDEARDWIAAGGLEHVRVAAAEEGMRGGLLVVPMGQFFGGQSVAMTGIAGVGVPPEHRGLSVAAALMRSTLNELAEKGVPLSALFASTSALYRSVGYELAGSRFRVRLRARDVSVRERTLPLRRAHASDAHAVERAYGRYAAQLTGYLDRGPYIWGRVRKPLGIAAKGYVVEVDGEVEGYVLFNARRTRSVRQDIVCSDLVALTSRAGRRLLTLLADLRSLCDDIAWCAGPADALLLELPDHEYRMELVEHWMLRIANVECALRARGYPASCRGELHLEVRDTTIPLNQGRYVLAIEHGRAEIRRGGTGALVLDVRALAALYSGFLPPEALRRAGLLAGTVEALALARDVFAGPAPAMSDSF